MAAWKVSAGVGQGASVSSGKLEVAAKGDLTGTPVWSWTNASAFPFDVNSSRIVPGDSVTRTQVFTVSARGDHLGLTGDLNLPLAVTGGDATLVAKLTANTTTTLSASGTWPAGVRVDPTGKLVVDSGTARGADLVFDVKVTSVVQWPLGAADADTASTMGQTVSLAGANLVLTQS
jgi:alternate signal-mediated exported protein